MTRTLLFDADGSLRRAEPRARAMVLFALGFTALLTACCEDRRSPEEHIRARLDEGAAALEAKEVAKAADILSERYRDGSGRDRRAMKALTFFLLRQGPVRLSLRDVQIATDPGGATATAQLQVIAVQGHARIERVADVLPQGARKVDLTLKLVNDAGEWYVTAIDGDGLRPPAL